MDGENKGKPYEQMDDLGVPIFLETPTCTCVNITLVDRRFYSLNTSTSSLQGSSSSAAQAMDESTRPERERPATERA